MRPMGILLVATGILACVLLLSYFTRNKLKGNTSEPLIVTFNKWQDFTNKPDGFLPVNKDESCEGGMFKGNRFMKPDDPSVVLIYDDAGNFVGSQVGIYPEELDTAVGSYSTDWRNWYDNNPQIIKEEIGGKIVSLMTIYKQDPDTICSSTGPKTNDALYVIHHEGDVKYLKVDRNDISSLIKDGWVENICIEKMGFHYRYKVGGVDWDCLKVQTPIFLLVIDNKVIGHGWNFPGVFSSTNFEQFPYEFVVKIIYPMPVCVIEAFNVTKGYAAEHVYYVDNPQSVKCPKK